MSWCSSPKLPWTSFPWTLFGRPLLRRMLAVFWKRKRLQPAVFVSAAERASRACLQVLPPELPFRLQCFGSSDSSVLLQWRLWHLCLPLCKRPISLSWLRPGLPVTQLVRRAAPVVSSRHARQAPLSSPRLSWRTSTRS